VKTPRTAKPNTPKPAAQPSPPKSGAQVSAPDKARELNVTLAVVTGFSLALLVVSAAFFGPAGKRWLPLVVGPAAAGLYLLMKRYLFKSMPAPALIQADVPITLALAGGLPLVIVACACAAALWQGHDFSIAVIAAGVWFGLTVESALRK
jgi:hypothetical protein